MSFDTTAECPICMEECQCATNKVITECGHTFHTNCLMKSVAHNGFGCPYCRTKMAEDIYNSEHEDDEYYDEYAENEEDFDDDDRTYDTYDAAEADFYRINENANRILGGFRWLFNRANHEETIVYEEEDDEMEHDAIRARPRGAMIRPEIPVEPPSPKPSVEYLSKKLVEQGVTIEDLLKSYLVYHSDYDSMEAEFAIIEDSTFEKVHALVINFQP